MTYFNDSSPPEADSIQSPCVGTCRLNEHDVCVGCYRTRADIQAWSRANNDQKRDILQKVSARAQESVADIVIDIKKDS